MMVTFEAGVDDNDERASKASFRIVGRVTWVGRRVSR